MCMKMIFAIQCLNRTGSIVLGLSVDVLSYGI